MISLVLFKMDKQSDFHLSFFQIVGAWRDLTVVTKLMKNFKSFRGFGESCFKVHSSVSVRRDPFGEQLRSRPLWLDLWPGPTPEVRDSRTSRHSAHAQSQVWQIWLVLVSIYCVYKTGCRWTWPWVPISSAWQKGPLGMRLQMTNLNIARSPWHCLISNREGLGMSL